MRKKRNDPIDRAIGDLDAQIASLQRQLREMPAASSGPTPQRRIAEFVKGVVAQPKRMAESSARPRKDLFDVQAEPLKELEAEAIAFASKPVADLFTPALETAQVVPPQEKLAHYLGAGSIKTYKPLKRVRRETRNRFFMWVGLSFLALWIIWFVVR